MDKGSKPSGIKYRLREREREREGRRERLVSKVRFLFSPDVGLLRLLFTPLRLLSISKDRRAALLSIAGKGEVEESIEPSGATTAVEEVAAGPIASPS